MFVMFDVLQKVINDDLDIMDNVLRSSLPRCLFVLCGPCKEGFTLPYNISPLHYSALPRLRHS